MRNILYSNIFVKKSYTKRKHLKSDEHEHQESDRDWILHGRGCERMSPKVPMEKKVCFLLPAAARLIDNFLETTEQVHCTTVT